MDSDEGLFEETDNLNYRDFGTIDWFRELALDQKRHRKLKDNTQKKTASILSNMWGKKMTFLNSTFLLKRTKNARIHATISYLSLTPVVRNPNNFCCF